MADPGARQTCAFPATSSGDELPVELADSRSRQEWLRAAKRALDAEQSSRP